MKWIQKSGDKWIETDYANSIWADNNCPVLLGVIFLILFIVIAKYPVESLQIVGNVVLWIVEALCNIIAWIGNLI